MILNTKVSYLRTSYCNGIVFCNSWQNLLLLSLILQNISLFFVCSKTLLSKERISNRDNDSRCITFRSLINHSFSCWHHCTITNFRISNLFILSIPINFYILCKEVALRDSYVPKIHVAIVLCMSTYLRPYVTSFNSWKPVLILIPNWNQKGIDSMIFTFHNSLSDD